MDQSKPSPIANTVQFVNEKQAAQLTGLSVNTLRAWRHRCRGPRYHKIDGRSIRYRLSDLEQFMASFMVEPAN